ncbi:ABC transporter permease [Oceaniglobus trochenteri]|uniref:ABC transporter permease n=1 Tax=Oceaniglobus trochenteri TaxID=2763260 RepID=UPI001CFFD462|nr:ABC transporter permease [Oceaniglobus trochenteri]
MSVPPVPQCGFAPLPRTDTAERIATPTVPYWTDVWRRLRANRPALAGLVFIVVLIFTAIFGPMLSPFSYYEQNLRLSNIPPILRPYTVTGEDGSQERFFLNSGNFALYGITEDGRMTDILRGKADMLNRRTTYDIAGRDVVVDYKSLPVSVSIDDSIALPGGRVWNRTYLFGTDQLGRDVLVRQMYGARISLLVAFVATLVNFFIGVAWGGVAGYAGGAVDTAMMRIVEVIATIPLTLYVILIMVFLDSGLTSIVIAIGTVFWVDMARIVRGQILTLKQSDYVAAARTMGAGPVRIITRHLLPNTIGPILVTLTMLIPSAIFIESFMSFIGLGVTPPLASWGTLTSNAVETMRSYPHQLFFPAAALSLTMFAFNFLGDGLRDALDPRLRK